MSTALDAAARKLFETDPEIARDRDVFKSFDKMPPELQQWWRDRAERKIAELRLLSNSGYDARKDM